MIDKNLLIELGWSTDLIDEVTRVGQYLKESEIETQPLDFEVSNHETCSGQSANYFDGLVRTSGSSRL